MLMKSILILALLLALTACAESVQSSPGALDTAPSLQEEIPIAAPSGAPLPSSRAQLPYPPAQPPKPYAAQVVEDTVNKIVRPGMGTQEKAQAAYEYIIENTWFSQPIALDIWKIRGSRDEKAPSYVENRALSPLLFGIGSCEDYAAALAMLLEGMGIEARYVPGLTYSVDGILVDHAWTAAEIDGVWYHLDSQLEDNIIRGDTLKYKFFMKSDETMLASHRWGENLIAYGGLTAKQNEEIRQNWLVPECPEDFPAPPPKRIAPEQKPDITAIMEQLEAERREYESVYGRPAQGKLNITPPVFGDDGYPVNN